MLSFEPPLEAVFVVISSIIAINCVWLQVVVFEGIYGSRLDLCSGMIVAYSLLVSLLIRMLAKHL